MARHVAGRPGPCYPQRGPPFQSTHNDSKHTCCLKQANLARSECIDETRGCPACSAFCSPTVQLSFSKGCQKMLLAPFSAKNIVLHIDFFFLQNSQVWIKINYLLLPASLFVSWVLWKCYVSRSDGLARRKPRTWGIQDGWQRSRLVRSP